MRASTTIAELAGAFAKAQGAFVNPAKDREVTVTTKTGSSYTFKYATFAAIVDAVRKPLADNGMSFLQITSADEHGHLLTTRLLHASGEWLEFDTPVFVASEGAQAFGSGVTYAKRYALSTMLGITADEDDDANAADGNQADMRSRGPAQRPPPPARPALPGAAAAQNGIAAAANNEAAETFTAQAIERIGKFRHQEERVAWWHQNKKYIEKLEARYPALFERLLDAYDKGESLPHIMQAG